MVSEIALVATGDGLSGPFFLSVAHPGTARELKAQPARPCARRYAAAFVLATRDALLAAVSAVYRLSLSLPTLPYEDYVREIAHHGNTEVERVQKVRLGQARFRAAVMVYWNGTCSLTEVTEPALLRASHIIPWADCDSDQERLNVHNGLLLSALWDAAFDSGLVTFDEVGNAIASPRLGPAAYRALKVDAAPPLQLVDEHRVRLAWHRQERWVSD